MAEEVSRLITERDDLSNLLAGCFDSTSSVHLYFNQPESVKMVYPAIRYAFDQGTNIHASDAVYAQKQSYSVVVIDRNPLSDIARRVSKLPNCRQGRPYVSDNLYHFPFTFTYFCKEVMTNGRTVRP